MQRLLQDELPDDNYQVLKFICRFLTLVGTHSPPDLLKVCLYSFLISFYFQVVDNCRSNRMDVKNLAIVFGPNLLWSKSQASLTSLGFVNSCSELLITHVDELFQK